MQGYFASCVGSCQRISPPASNPPSTSSFEAYQTLQSDDTSDQIWIELEIITDTVDDFLD
jgi:hypothetical protein